MLANPNAREEATPREHATWNHEREMAELQVSHAQTIARLQLEEARLEAKWRSWLSIPKAIIILPVRILFVIPVCIYAARKQEIPKELWSFLGH